MIKKLKVYSRYTNFRNTACQAHKNHPSVSYEDVWLKSALEGERGVLLITENANTAS